MKYTMPMTLALVLAVALVASHIAVAASGSLRWIPQGPYPPKGGCQPISFDQPDSIAVNRLDDIFIADDTGRNAVQEVTAGGSGTIRTVLSRRVDPIRAGHYFGISLAIGPGASLYLAVKDRGTVERLNANGTLTLIAGEPGDKRLVDGSPSKARLKAPNAIAIGEDGTIYVDDTRTIRRIAPDGSITTLAGDLSAKGPHPVEGGPPDYANGQGSKGAFAAANGIAVDHTGIIYVADSYEGELDRQGVSIGLVRRVTPAGRVTTVAGNLYGTGSSDFDGVGIRAGFSAIFGIAMDRIGNMYVTEPYTPSVRKITKRYDVSTVVGGEDGAATAPTGLVAPTAIAVDDNGTLFVTDDVAFDGTRNRPTDWLHRIVGQQLDTLCRTNEKH